ncbi:MAG: cytochrome c biogenesis protein ResB [Gemmataceae bacterium]
MTRKKHGKPDRIPLPPSPPAALAELDETGITSKASAHVTTAAAPAKSAAPPTERFWLGVVVVRLAEWFGSLQLAVVLLSLFAVVLAVGTILESWYSAKVAQDLLYRTWWFMLLMGMLATTITCAAIKKIRFRGPDAVGGDIDGASYRATLNYWWPWLIVAGIFIFLIVAEITENLGLQLLAVGVGVAVVSLALWYVQQRWPVERWWPWQRHQTGFLITHVGLLTMIAGGVLNFWGTDALMSVIDTPDPRYSRWGPNTTSEIVDNHLSLIRVQLPNGEQREFGFEPGSLAWRPDAYFQPNSDLLLDFLSVLAHPWPRGWSKRLDAEAHLEVLAFYPHVEQEEFGPAREGDVGPTFPAVKFQITSARAGAFPEKWLAFNVRNQAEMLGPGQVEFLARALTPAQLREFLQPPPPSAKGHLALVRDGQRHLLAVEDHLDQTKPIGDTEWSLRVVRQMSDTPADNDVPAIPAMLHVLMVRDDGSSVNAMTFSRPFGVNPERLIEVGHWVPMPGEKQLPKVMPDLDGWQVWYHAPDYSQDQSHLRGGLQFATDQSGKLYFRSFTRDEKGAFVFEASGEARPELPRPRIWERMKGLLKIIDYVPNAVQGPYYIPQHRVPGLVDPTTPSAIRCRLTVGADSQEFWLEKVPQGLTRVRVGGKDYRVGFNDYTQQLDFAITLRRAEQTVDPGTQNPASYTSFVQLTDEAKNIQREDRIITMNAPLNHGGYKLYQTGFTPLGFDDKQKPVNASTFTVSNDPGLWLKYAGSTMLALGIFCMFYMKAYFFKPRGRRSGTAPAAA